MASNARKIRRDREFKKAGIKASEIVARAETEKESANKFLALAIERADDMEQRLQTVTAQYDELLLTNQSARVCENHADQFCGTDCLVCTNDQLMRTVKEQSLLIGNQKIDLVVRQTQIRDLQSEDKDASKLRRRLATAKADLAAARSEINKSKRVDLF